MSALQSVRLYGKMGSTFGRDFQFVGNTVRDAVRAMIGMVPGFKRYMQRAHHHGITFAIFIGDKNIKEHDFDAPTGGEPIRIVPVPMGNKRQGALNTIIGVVIIIVGVILLYTPASGLGWPTIKFGAAMALGGIATMLSPAPVGPGARESADNRPNYTFDGPKNTQIQGAVIPVAYGECWAGGAYASAGILNEDM